MRMVMASVALLIFSSTVYSEETKTTETSFPGASIHQHQTYSTSEKHFNETKDEIKKRLASGDKSVLGNLPKEPTVTIRTEAKFSKEFLGKTQKPIGAHESRVHHVTESAAERAIKEHEKETGKTVGLNN